jgi:hypothetical protein
MIGKEMDARGKPDGIQLWPLVPRSGLFGRVSKDEARRAHASASWFETAQERLLTMRRDV